VRGREKFLCVRLVARSEDGFRLPAGSTSDLFKIFEWYTGDVVQSEARDRGDLHLLVVIRMNAWLPPSADPNRLPVIHSRPHPHSPPSLTAPAWASRI
jgi:hypothetical protein